MSCLRKGDALPVKEPSCHATGDSTEHYMVPIDKPRPSRTVEPAVEAKERRKDQASHLERSLLDERAHSVPEGRPDTAQTRELPKVKSGKSGAANMATPPGGTSSSSFKIMENAYDSLERWRLGTSKSQTSRFLVLKIVLGHGLGHSCKAAKWCCFGLAFKHPCISSLHEGKFSTVCVRLNPILREFHVGTCRSEWLGM